MTEYFECNHFEFVKDFDKGMKDFIIQVMAESDTKVGKGSFTWDMIHGNSGVCSVSPTSVFIMKQREKLIHMVIAINVSKEVQ